MKTRVSDWKLEPSQESKIASKFKVHAPEIKTAVTHWIGIDEFIITLTNCDYSNCSNNAIGVIKLSAVFLLQDGQRIVSINTG